MAEFQQPVPSSMPHNWPPFFSALSVSLHFSSLALCAQFLVFAFANSVELSPLFFRSLQPAVCAACVCTSASCVLLETKNHFLIKNFQQNFATLFHKHIIAHTIRIVYVPRAAFSEIGWIDGSIQIAITIKMYI